TIIGLVAFVLPRFLPFSSAHVYGVIMVLLYIISPISIIFSIMPALKRGGVALERILSLNDYPQEPLAETVSMPEWNTISLKQIRYQYANPTENTENFHIEVNDLQFCKGEITFIVGGNGSGKSTLSKLISLHYTP